ncbi:hypothetical protein AB0C14_26805, partial [Microbispora hainanensis]
MKIASLLRLVGAAIISRNMLGRHAAAGTARTWRRLSAAALLAVGLAVAGTLTSPGVAVAESNGGVRVMPLGDSITEGTQVPGGYRIGLWQR